MTAAPNFHAEMRLVLRNRALDAARTLVCTEGWDAVSMSRIAKDVGISRPVLYKEIGTKQELAAALIQREVDEFLAGVIEGLAAHPDDPVAGLSAGTEFALRFGEANPLLEAIFQRRRGGGEDSLLHALVADTDPVLARAIDALAAALREQYGLASIDDETLLPVVEIIVRLTLSHIFQPLGPTDRAVAQVATVVAGLVAAVAG